MFSKLAKFIYLLILLIPCSTANAYVYSTEKISIQEDQKSHKIMAAASSVVVKSVDRFYGIDSKYMYISDDNYINVLNFENELVDELPIRNEYIIDLIRNEDYIYLASRSNERTGDYFWEATHKITVCKISENCRIIKSGNFGISALAYFNNRLFASIFNWKDMLYGIIPDAGPLDSQLISIDLSGNEETINLPRSLGIWDIYTNDNILYMLVNSAYMDEGEGNILGIWSYAINSNSEFERINGYLPFTDPASQDTREFCSSFETNGVLLLCGIQYFDNRYYKHIYRNSLVDLRNGRARIIKEGKEIISLSNLYLNDGTIYYIDIAKKIKVKNFSE